MAKKKIWDSPEKAEREAVKTENQFNELMSHLFDAHIRGDGISATEMFGHSLVNLVYKLCEVALNLACWDNSSPDGTLEFPTLVEVGNLKKDIGTIFPAEARVAAASLKEIKKECDKSMDIDLSQLDYMLVVAEFFMRAMIEISNRNRGIIENIYNSLNNAKRRLIEIAREANRFNSNNRFNLIVLKKDEDEYTEEELDKIYARKTRNRDKHLAPLFIMEIMRGTSKEEKMSVTTVQEILEQEYGIRLERKAVGRALTQLQEADFLCKMQDENGYWYDKELNRNILY